MILSATSGPDNDNCRPDEVKIVLIVAHCLITFTFRPVVLFICAFVFIICAQSCEMSGIWEIYLCKNFGDLG